MKKNLLLLPAALACFLSTWSQPPGQFQKDSVNEYCDCQQRSQVLNDLSRFIPGDNIPEITLRANFIFMQKEDGSGGFEEPNAIHQRFWHEVIGTVNGPENSLNYKYAHLKNEDDGKSCYDGYVKDSRIRFQINPIYVRDSYGWNNENDNCSANCPDIYGCNWYLNRLHDSITGTASIPKGINVFFTEKGSAYDTIVSMKKLKISLIGSHACSMMPGCDPDRNLKCHMPDVFLGFYSKSLIPSSPEWDTALFWNPYDRTILYSSNTFNWAVDNTSFGIVHELGHSLGLGHGYNHCHHNIMNNSSSADRTCFMLKQLALVHKNLCTTVLRNYIEGCPYRSDNVFEITGDELIDFDFTWFGDIVVRSGGTLTITCTVRMPDNARIIVERGARLIMQGGRITNACGGKWGGIQVLGNSERMKRKRLKKEHPQNPGDIYDFVSGKKGIYPNAGDDHGIVVMNKAIIENAACAITTGSETLIREKRFAGGILLAENSAFRNNGMAIKLMKFNYKPGDLPAAYRVRNCVFESDNPVVDEKSSSFIQMSGVCGSEITGNIFINSAK